MTDANTTLMSVNDLVIRVNMVANVKMNLEHFIATVPLDMAALIVKKISTNVLISHVLMEAPASTQSMISSVLAEKVSRHGPRSGHPYRNTGINFKTPRIEC